MQPRPGHRKLVKHYEDPGHVRELTFSCYQRLPLLTNDIWREMLSRAIDAAGERECGLSKNAAQRTKYRYDATSWETAMEINSSIGLVIGAGLGLVAGVAFGDAGVGLIFGAGLGLVFGAGFPSRSTADS